MTKIYVASSWRNEFQPAAVRMLRAAGHEVYDFKNPADGVTGFHWSEIDKEWEKWDTWKYRDALRHPIAVGGFASDYTAMEWADTFVGIQPFGCSASMEMGWAAGAGKNTILLLEQGKPELMVKMFDHICCTMQEVIECLQED